MLKHAATVLTGLTITAAASAGDAEVWSMFIETTGNDASWTSPTAVNPDADQYHILTETTLFEMDVSWLVFDFTINLLDQFPPGDLVIDQTIDGPAPVVILDSPILFPLPPDPPSIQLDAFIEIDAAGFGQGSMTNVTLGTLEIDLGDPFGVQTVQIEAIRQASTITVTPITLNPSDLDQDGVVGVLDLLQLLGAWGPCKGCIEDIDGDGTVGVLDLLALLGAWGPA